MPSSDWSSPPTSPKWGFSHPPRSRFWYIRLHSSRIIIALVLATVAYFSTRNHHGSYFKPKHAPSLRYKNVDWRMYAYSQYATDSAYLCNALMIFEALDRLGSKADRILLYPNHWDTIVSNRTDRDSQLLVKAVEEYKVKLIPVKLETIARGSGDGNEAADSRGSHNWDTSVTKFLTFNQTQYLRIIHLDSDSTILKPMDELFLLPQITVAMPHAYWVPPSLSSHLILLEPSLNEAERLLHLAHTISSNGPTYDMDILNKIYNASAMVLPHRHYGLLSGEFRTTYHASFLGNDYETWDPDHTMRDASIVYFSDWPLPKPWIMWPQTLMAEMRPKCDNNPGTAAESGCRSREIWLELYEDFRKRRRNVCALLSVPAPEWPPRKKEADAGPSSIEAIAISRVSATAIVESTEIAVNEAKSESV